MFIDTVVVDFVVALEVLCIIARKLGGCTENVGHVLVLLLVQGSRDWQLADLPTLRRGANGHGIGFAHSFVVGLIVVERV